LQFVPQPRAKGGSSSPGSSRRGFTSSAANGKNLLHERLRQVEGTPTGGSGSGANWTADLRKAPPPVSLNTPGTICSACPLTSGGRWREVQPFSRIVAMAGPDEVVALRFKVSYIAVGVERLNAARASVL
jgi:hypothetical protein